MTYHLNNWNGDTFTANSASTETYTPDAVLILVDGVHGRYCWQYLGERFADQLYGETDAPDMQASIEALMEGPDSDDYWMHADWLKDNAVLIDGDQVYFLTVLPDTQDIAAVPVGMRDGFNAACESI